MMILGWRLHHISGSVEAGYVHISSSAFREALARIKRIIGAPYAWPLPTLQPCYVCTLYTVHSAIYIKWPSRDAKSDKHCKRACAICSSPAVLIFGCVRAKFA